MMFQMNVVSNGQVSIERGLWYTDLKRRGIIQMWSQMSRCQMKVFWNELSSSEWSQLYFSDIESFLKNNLFAAQGQYSITNII